MTPDRLFYPLMILVVAALIALAMVYPQGEGARSPGPFGHDPVQQSVEAQAALRHNAKIEAQTKAAIKSLKDKPGS
jgi:hypothetical protein